MESNQTDGTRIVIVGGGAAALEAMMALRALGGERAVISLYAPRDDFVMRPLAVGESFGTEEVLKFDLKDLAANSGASFHQKGVASVEPEKRRIMLGDGEEVEYDFLVVATGTKSLWVVPGARTFWGPDSQENIADVLELMRTNTSSHIVLTMPDRAGWPLPIYELALFFASKAKKEPDLDGAITILSPEDTPLEIFGTRASDIVSRLLEDNRIEFLAGTTPLAYGDGHLSTKPRSSISADAVITLPRLTGRHISGLPYNEAGFIPADRFGLIEGLEREYVAGDVMAYPVKFGGFATGQADVTAGSIASIAWHSESPDPFHPDLRATLLTPDGPVFLGEDADWSALDQEVASEDWNRVRKIRGKYLSPALIRAVKR